jgi:hypothetical protein
VVVAAGVEERIGIEQAPGWLLATVRPGHERSVRVIDTDGSDVSAELLDVELGEVRVRATTTPLMMTRTEAATRADCLTYLLGRADVPASHAATSSPANRSSSGTLVATNDHKSS